MGNTCEPKASVRFLREAVLLANARRQPGH
jgi:hypothetical protein